MVIFLKSVSLEVIFKYAWFSVKPVPLRYFYKNQ